VDLLPLSGEAVPIPTSVRCRDDARTRLQGRGMAAWYRRWRRGPLRDVRELLVPYRLFEVEVTNAGRRRTGWLAVDAVSGRLDPYTFEAPPAAAAFPLRSGAAAVPEVVDAARLREAAAEHTRRRVFTAGFFQVRNLSIDVGDTGVVLYLPYWAGIHGHGRGAWVEVLGGLRGTREGAKLRDVLAPWLAEASPVR
jgi:hypothetical protein